MLKTALKYASAGICALPAIPAQKRPAGRWKQYQQRRPTDDEVGTLFRNAAGICIVAGPVSGNVEMIDFDFGALKFDEWKSQIPPDLFARLVVERSQSGGKHVIYRTEAPPPGNLKLATMQIETDSPDPVTIGPKEVTPRMAGGRYVVSATLIETRGTGGIFLCAPTPGYELEQGNIENMPVISATERELLINAARKLGNKQEQSICESRIRHNSSFDSQNKLNETQNYSLPNIIDQHEYARPGDEYNARGRDHFRAILQAHGWKRVGQRGANEHWRRPGKETGTSATFNGQVFYVFSSNADPFWPDKGYSPFQAYALLEHQGNFHEAARALAEAGFGSESGAEADVSGLLDSLDKSARTGAENAPEPTPDDLIVDASELVRQETKLREVLIDGLLRRGETLNLIAAPKSRKSWLVLQLAVAFASGKPWLTFGVRPGRVLIIDAELHRETISDRIRRVSEAMGVELESGMIDVMPLRGRQMTMEKISKLLARVPQGKYQIIIFDCLYRFLTGEENSNTDMREEYNRIDNLAEITNSGIIIVHHTSKGSQANKLLTDLGSGAGAQSRAVDAHVALRPHREQDCISVHAVCRSFPPPEPFVIRLNFPIWEPDFDLDADDMDGVLKVQSSQKMKITYEDFLRIFVTDTPLTEAEIVTAATDANIAANAARRHLLAGVDSGDIIELSGIGPRKARGYRRASARDRETEWESVTNYIQDHPDASAREISRVTGIGRNKVSAILKDLRNGTI